MKTYITDYITKEQLDNMKAGDKITFTIQGTKHVIKRISNMNEKDYRWCCPKYSMNDRYSAREILSTSFVTATY